MSPTAANSAYIFWRPQVYTSISTVNYTKISKYVLKTCILEVLWGESLLREVGSNRSSLTGYCMLRGTVPAACQIQVRFPKKELNDMKSIDLKIIIAYLRRWGIILQGSFKWERILNPFGGLAAHLTELGGTYKIWDLIFQLEEKFNAKP